MALRAGDGRGWSVRQLYYACDERRARLFDQGLAGFLFGTDNVRLGWLSVVLLPDEAATSLAGAALDNDRALGVLGARYSANAYPFSVRYQNCNQWVMELLAQALGGLDATAPDARARAQAWLQAQGYEPAVFEVPWHPLEWVVGLMSLLHNDDHPPADLAANRYRVSMPTAIEDFVRARVPGARRLALCHADARVVIHEGWDEIAEGCLPGPGDRVLDLDAP